MPILDANSLDFFSHSADQTRRMGIRLGSLLGKGDIICLSGDLGAGKTTLVQGIARGWGSLDAVSSPTFILVNVYRRPDGTTLSHLDAYRLQSALEAEDLDLEPLMENGPVVIEWPERIAEVLPNERLWVSMRWLADEQRGLLFKGTGKKYLDMIHKMKKFGYGGV
ncbi:MAG: tRNA (adenosine(37)-N6)-threonylcarbamoyltransferase complex ATPase subunit type 1 TsaE [Anaerolinea sp.]|nr:tRNA (adenosine(37)-N6)-threonylcarbamoyltransferase complex ATPase subunit type 1 TsaE [Anaerolinea sp.]